MYVFQVGVLGTLVALLGVLSKVAATFGVSVIDLFWRVRHCVGERHRLLGLAIRLSPERVIGYELALNRGQ